MRCVTGTWYENGQLVPSHNIARRPAAYQPFESVPPYPGAPVQQPSTFDGNPEYPHRAAPGEECGYPTIQEWESARPRRPIDRGAALPYETTRMEVFGVENGVSRLTTGNQFDENYWNDQPATSGRNPNPASGANTAQQPPQRSQTLPSYNTQGGFQAGGGYPAPNVQQAQTSHQASDPRQDSLQHNNTFPQAPGQPGHPAQPAHRPIPPVSLSIVKVVQRTPLTKWTLGTDATACCQTARRSRNPETSCPKTTTRTPRQFIR